EDEPQSGTGNPEFATHITSKELCEDLFLVCPGDPEPFVTHPDPGLIADPLGGHLDYSALGRILDRVREEIPDHLGEAVAVAADGKWLPGRLKPQLVGVALGRVERDLG